MSLLFYMVNTKKHAISIAHTLSEPSKMPCKGYSIPASRCITGKKMRKVKNSICSACYALKGMYVFSNVQNALEKRFQSLKNPLWVAAMVKLITKEKFFRWHDSGDLQGVWHLKKIIAVCEQTPDTEHWLPTREFLFVKQYVLEGGIIPMNLTIRFSALHFDGKAPEKLAKELGVQCSGARDTAYSCPAPKQNNECGDCRKCWSKDIFNISYKKH